jgi:hypothetical protein
MKMGEKANDQINGLVRWKMEVGDAASDWIMGYQSRFTWAGKPGPRGQKIGEK